MEQEKRKPTWVDKALIIAVLTFVVWALFFLPARAGEEQRVHLLVCSLETQDCTIQTARIYFTIPTDRLTPMGCLQIGMMEMARMDGLYDQKTERVVTTCR